MILGVGYSSHARALPCFDALCGWAAGADPLRFACPHDGQRTLVPPWMRAEQRRPLREGGAGTSAHAGSRLPATLWAHLSECGQSRSVRKKFSSRKHTLPALGPARPPVPIGAGGPGVLPTPVRSGCVSWRRRDRPAGRPAWSSRTRGRKARHSLRVSWVPTRCCSGVFSCCHTSTFPLLVYFFPVFIRFK